MSIHASRVAFVTGAGGGIGRAVSRILARDGALVVASDISEKQAEETVKALQNPGDHLAVQIDVTNSDSVKKAFEKTISHYGRCPVLLTQAAGITRENFIKNLDEQQFMDVINVNLKGTYLVQKQMLKCFEESNETSGAVVNISSIVAKHGNIGQGNYSSSKAGVEAFTKTSAKELARNGIRVNCVAPGFIDTTMIETVPEKVKNMVLFATPLQRLGRPEEVAEVVSFLLSDRSSFMTASVIEVAGGLSA